MNQEQIFDDYTRTTSPQTQWTVKNKNISAHEAAPMILELINRQMDKLQVKLPILHITLKEEIWKIFRKMKKTRRLRKQKRRSIELQERYLKCRRPDNKQEKLTKTKWLTIFNLYLLMRNIRPHPLNQIFLETDWPNHPRMTIGKINPKKKEILINSEKFKQKKIKKF